MSDPETLWTDREAEENPALPPLPRAERGVLLEVGDWCAAEGCEAAALARAAMALGRLDGALAVTPEGQRAGALTRLAMAETEVLLWAVGTPLAPEDLGRDLMDVPAHVEPETLRLARWAVRRLQGRGRLDELRDFLGLQRVEQGAGGSGLLRPAGAEFDAAAREFEGRMAEVAKAHPLTQAAYGLALWRLSDLSPEGQEIEAACWAGRWMAADCVALAFAPLGHHGRPVWSAGGPPVERLGRWYRAVEQGAEAARQQFARLSGWSARAEVAVARIKGDNPARIIAALTAAPVLTTAMVEQAAGISRDTAERLLARMAAMGLVREITGAKRFRLWAAML